MYGKVISAELLNAASFSDEMFVSLGLISSIELIVNGLNKENYSGKYTDSFIQLVNAVMDKITSNMPEFTRGFSYDDYETLSRFLVENEHLKNIPYVQKALLSRVLMEWGDKVPVLCENDTLEMLHKRALEVNAFFEFIEAKQTSLVEQTFYENIAKKIQKKFSELLIDRIRIDMLAVSYFQQLEYYNFVKQLFADFPIRSVVTRINNEMFGGIVHALDARDNPLNEKTLEVYLQALKGLNKIAGMELAEKEILANTLVMKYETFGIPLDRFGEYAESLQNDLQYVLDCIPFSFKIHSLLKNKLFLLRSSLFFTKPCADMQVS